ncbi:zf-CSL-domain-containing protein [Lactarius sanguifluus]|nr:zf-CSL-domain-containing protein [Lactarius sanguifluus]
MGAYYDEIEIEDMAWDDEKGVFHYPCPCGDRFEISRKQLANCEDIATCPSCSLIIRVIYDPLDFEDEPPDDEGASASEQEGGDGVDSDGDEDVFEDAMENLAISEKPRLVAATA